MSVDINKLKHIWDNNNKIIEPVGKEFYFEYIDQMADLFSAGSFFYYIFDFEHHQMELVHEDVNTILGIKPENFTLKKILGIIHPEDKERIQLKELKAADFFFNKIASEEILNYKMAYLMRLKNAEGYYKTILHQAKPLVLSKRGKIQKALVIDTDVTYLNLPIDHKISFLSRKSPSYYALETDDDYTLIDNNCEEKITNREREILKLLAEGKTIDEIADVLYISRHTVKTHKRNILQKSECNNITELVARCVREGVI